MEGGGPRPKCTEINMNDLSLVACDVHFKVLNTVLKSVKSAIQIKFKGRTNHSINKMSIMIMNTVLSRVTQRFYQDIRIVTIGQTRNITLRNFKPVN